MIGRLLAPLAILALGGLLLLEGLDVLSLTPGYAGAALLTAAGVALLVSGLTENPAESETS